MGSLEGLSQRFILCISFCLLCLSPSLHFLIPPYLCLFLCQFLKTPLLHAQTKRTMLCIKSINSTCRYTPITQMGAECVLCEPYVEAEGDAIK